MRYQAHGHICMRSLFDVTSFTMAASTRTKRSSKPTAWIGDPSLGVDMHKSSCLGVVSSRMHQPSPLEDLAEHARPAEPAHGPKRNQYNKRPSPAASWRLAT